MPRFDISLTGNSTGSIFNDAADRIPAYYIMNAQVQLNGKDDRWFVRGFIQNIANNNATTGLYVTDQSSGLFTNIFTLEPRRYGIAGGSSSRDVARHRSAARAGSDPRPFLLPPD